MDVSELKIPQHIAIIMDGNGRWAKKHHMPRTYGHTKGAEVLEQTLEDCGSLGVKYLTVYAFSTENWSRPYSEVEAIMNIFRKYLAGSLEKCMKNDVKFRVIGDRSRLDDDLAGQIKDFEEATKDNTGITFVVAINYGSRDEITRAVRKIAEDVQNGGKDPGGIDEAYIEGFFDTAGVPDPDLLIRTSGEVRLSNFLMWQLAYTEFYFTDIYWPEFNKDELIKAIKSYTKRDRRFGNAK